jgi:ferric-dicitrate binding protein FerR (iron transport regulator)
MKYNEDRSSVERLFIKRQLNKISPEEQAHLEQQIRDNPDAQAMEEFYQDAPNHELPNEKAINEAWLKLEEKMLHPKSRIFSLRKTWFAAAAAILILIIAGGYIFLAPQPQKQILAATTVTLHLAEGKDVSLTSNQIISSGSANIAANQQSMNFKAVNGAAKGMNIIDVPQKFDYKLTLSDGTEVTLNSVTRLKFPFSFTGDKREVFVEGEAYFKIAKNVDHPFIVHTAKGDITVLGTEFNVNTYTPDVLKTALVNGSVNVSSNNEVVNLKPGEELTWNKNKHTISELEARSTLSWINGVLYFHNTPLAEIARMIERWYGVPVKIDNEKLAAEPFTGNLEKSQPLEDFLKPMKGIVNMRCYYEGNVLHMAR